MKSDAELLRQYVEEGSEPAFGELVRRHLGLVYSAAVRQCGGNPSLAEDVTQSVFIILARQSPSLATHETLAGWLHTCTRYTTLRALRDARRRHDRELKAAAMQINHAPKPSWDEVRPLLDEAVGHLNAADRQAVLLRFFQGRSHREVGAALGVAEDAARVRVDRALDKLRRHFARRGIVATGALLGETILAHAAEVEPAGLAGRISKGAARAVGPLIGSTWMLRLILMSTKKKIMIAAAVFLAVCLFSLLWPDWAWSHPHVQPLAQAGSQKAAAPSRSGHIEAPAPPAAEAPAPAPEVVTMVDTPSEVANPGQPQAEAALPTAPLPPPPPATGPGGRGLNFGQGGNNFRSVYRNFFQKMNFTPEQQDAFLKILNNQQEQTAALTHAAMNKVSKEQLAEMTSNFLKELSADPDPRSHDTWVLTTTLENRINNLIGIASQVQALNEETDSQLRQMLGGDEGFEAYQTYVNQEGVRQWVNHYYGGALQRAGAAGLTADQQEALVEIVAKSLQPGDPNSRLAHLNQVLDQATGILARDQLEVLQANPIGAGLSYYRLHPQP